MVGAKFECALFLVEGVRERPDFSAVRFSVEEAKVA
jgi:hypothetical protein